MKRLLLLVYIFLSGVNAFCQTEEPTIIFLFRHAEAQFPPYKEDPPNPDLNNAGSQRAQLLKRTLTATGITEAFSTQRKRTIQTIKPLAEELELEIQIYDGKQLEALAEQLKSKKGRIAVSGHSNTTPQLVKLLGGDPGEPINEKTQFDRIYVVTLVDGDAISTVLLKYGSNYD